MYNHIIAIIPFLRAGADKSLKDSPAGPGICPGFSFLRMGNIIFRMDKENLVKITQLRHRLHQCAELSGRERETGRLLREFLKDNTSLEIVEKNGWFYAVKLGADPEAGSIAFRADMDALPIEESIPLPYASLHAGVSHKCGHDGHCAALCGLALELDRLAPAGTVYLLFQKAEEIGDGGKYCAAFIKETRISEVYAFHNLNDFPENSIVYRRGLTQPASEGLELRFLGKTSHASAPADGLHLKTVDMVKLWRASEDFGYCLKECPGAMVYIGTGEKYPAIHTKEYDFNDRILETAADMFLALAQGA